MRNVPVAALEDLPRDVLAVGTDYPDGYAQARHHHRRAQFLYAATGVMEVDTDDGAWTVPTDRAVLIPPGVPHGVRYSGVSTRSLYIEPAAAPWWPSRCTVVDVTPLLRELLLAAVDVDAEYDEARRDGAVAALLLHEIAALAPLPLHVPLPADEELRALCRDYLTAPDVAVGNAEWAARCGRSERSFTARTRVTGLVVEDGRVVGVEAVTIEDAPSAVRRRFAVLTRISAKPGVYHQGLRAAMQRLLDRIEHRHGRPIRIRARSGVVLSTGGFIANGAMVREHAPGYPWAQGLPLGTAGDDGSGIELGRSVGGATDRMDSLSNWRFIAPPSAYLGALAVDVDGRRMVDESRYGAALGAAIAEAPGHRAWLLVDADLAARAREQLGDQTVWFQRLQLERLLRIGSVSAPTVEEAARRAGVDPAGLRRTVDAHNDAIAQGRPDPLGKPDDLRRPAVAAPFTLLDISFTDRMTYPMPMLTLGGLVVDEDSGAVRTAAGATVDGLFAAGRTAVGICSNSYVSGLSLADCIFSGRRAGSHAAAAPSGARDGA
ncbi:FAD-binding protein [Tsukamurella tyrosinosolvens]|uniref:FAD-binding protein n=1 Tax=Tsukamurella tyrosinosolvens TaxID=57704 RepID=UPI000DF6E51A|nr:FAD-binding protein [Tsukamurella tyrosinosolvens]RDB46547.1 FAD-binding protein [Tsukamurella tyrosinosolvens]